MEAPLMHASVIISVMVLWIIVTLIIAACARKKLGLGPNEFFLAGRRLGGFVSGMTYAATTYSAFMLVGLVGLTYKTGISALGFEISYLLFTILFLIVFGPRFWLVGKKYGHITPPQLLGFRYENKGVAFVSAIICLVMLIPYSAVQLIGAGLLVSGLSGGTVPFFVGVVIVALLSGFTALWAGMKSVSWTDAFQAITMIIASIVAVLYVLMVFFGTPVDFFSAIKSNQPHLLEISWSPSLFIGLTLPWAFFALTNPQVSQRLFVPSSLKNLRKMIIYFSVFGFLYTVISVVFGLAATEMVPNLKNPDNAMPELLAKLPPLLAMALFIGIFAAASSTLGSIILTLSSLFTQDIIKTIHPALSARVEKLLAQGGMIVLLVLCVWFSTLKLGLIATLASMASGGLLVMSPAIIGAFFWKRGTATGALVSMTVGAALTGVLYFTGCKPLGWWPAVWGGMVTVIIFVAVSLVSKPPTQGAGIIIDTERALAEYRL